MVKFNVEGAQNVNVSKLIPLQKSLLEQLELMEVFTQTHQKYTQASRERREIECLKILYPATFRTVEEGDLFVGRLDFLPIGFGSVTSVGGVGHYCRFDQLHAFMDRMDEQYDGLYHDRIQAMYDYWLEHDVKTIYCKENLTETTISRFIDPTYPVLATARLSGMMLDYPKLLDLGTDGLRNQIEREMAKAGGPSEFLETGLEALGLFTKTAVALVANVRNQARTKSKQRKLQLEKMAEVLETISRDKPSTFPEALQLFWLYALMAGCINYGRLDDFLGPYLTCDLDEGRMSEEEAVVWIRSLWTMIENRRTTVNGRVIVGGQGRKHPKEADRFAHLAMKVCQSCRYVEPQFTLRVDETTDESLWKEAMDCLAQGATYPTIYNDSVNVPAVSYGMHVDEETAKRYVPFGCTEFVLWGQSTGTPNTLINLLKILTIYMNEGIDPMDGTYRLDEEMAQRIRPMEKIRTFEEFFQGYCDLLEVYMDLCARAQFASYEVMNREARFLFSSLLMDDCIERHHALLDGGVRYLGGTCETYGNINASDSLAAIKELVFDKRKYTLKQIIEAMNRNFEGDPSKRSGSAASCEKIRQDLLACPKYGNDLEAADSMANRLYEFVAKGIRQRGIDLGMQYFEIVISNNSLNTEWGQQTAASPDGRKKGLYMNPANNPQGGADRGAPTALLNSLATFDARYHAGSVQNIKFSRSLFKNRQSLIEQMFKVYFSKGGCQIMVTVINPNDLEDAILHPENYRNLIVRVAGYSAVFVDLAPAVQQELLSRTLYDESGL